MLLGQDLANSLLMLGDFSDQATANEELAETLLDWLLSGIWTPAAGGVINAAATKSGAPGQIFIQTIVNSPGLSGVLQNGPVIFQTAFTSFWTALNTGAAAFIPPATAVTPPVGLALLAQNLTPSPAGLLPPTATTREEGVFNFVNAIATTQTGAITVVPPPLTPAVLVITPPVAPTP